MKRKVSSGCSTSTISSCKPQCDAIALPDAPDFNSIETAHDHFRTLHENDTGDPLAAVMYAQFAADVLNDNTLASSLFNIATTRLEESETPCKTSAKHKIHEISVIKTVLGLAGAFQITTGDKDQVDDAQTKLNRALALDPLDPVVLGTLGKLAQYGRKDYIWAEELLQVSTEANPEHATLWIAYGNLHKEIGAKELREVTTSIMSYGNEEAPEKLNKKSDVSDINRPGIARLAAAKNCFERALCIDPNSCDAMGDLAALLHGYFGDHVKAKELYKRALLADSFHVRTMSNFALFFAEHESDPKSAKLLYERALLLQPNHANTLYNYAVLLDGAFHDSHGAITAYRRAIKCDQSHAFAWFNLAVCLSNTLGAEPLASRYVHSIEDESDDVNSITTEIENAFRRVRQLRPSDTESMVGLASILIRTKDSRVEQREAEKLLYMVLASDESHVEANVKLGQLYQMQRRFNDAKRHMLQAFELDPANVEALYSLGQLSYQNDELLVADEWFRNVLVVNNLHAGACFGLAQVSLERAHEMWNGQCTDLPLKATIHGVKRLANEAMSLVEPLTRSQTNDNNVEGDKSRSIGMKVEEAGQGALLKGKALLCLAQIESDTETKKNLVTQAQYALEQSISFAPKNSECLRVLGNLLFNDTDDTPHHDLGTAMMEEAEQLLEKSIARFGGKS